MSFATTYDSWLFDLDGTVWEGGRLLPFAADIINQAPVPVMYITNNASRGPEVVAEKLSELGIATDSEHVLTSAQAAIEMASAHLETGDVVYVLGSDSFKQLATDTGFVVAASADENPKAVLQGHNPETGWAQLSEGALSIRNGARYFASNLDTTLPSERGLLVGNGSMIAAVVSATGVEPESAGKPGPAMFHSAATKLESLKPLAIGDRLNTDIAGGVAAGMDTFHVLTGVSMHYAVLGAIEAERPTFVAKSLNDLLREPDELRPNAQGGFTAELNEQGNLVLSGGDEVSAVAALRTALATAWTVPHFVGQVETQGEVAAESVRLWK